MESNEPELHADATLSKNTGLSTGRIQGLSDGVFSIGMTLLVLELQVSEGDFHHGVVPALVSLAPHLFIYAMSFIALGVLWVAQHNQFVWIDRTDRTFLWTSLFYLMAVVLIPFSTKALAEFPNEVASVALYGINLVISGIFLYVLWVYATKGHRLIGPGVSHSVIDRFKERIAFTVIFNSIALIVSFYSPRIGILLFMLSQIAGIIPSISLDRFINFEEKVGKKS